MARSVAIGLQSGRGSTYAPSHAVDGVVFNLILVYLSNRAADAVTAVVAEVNVIGVGVRLVPLAVLV